MSEKIPVIFLAPSFGSVNNGPAIYAKYLWQEFGDSKSFDFHLVAPTVPYSHPKLHASGPAKNSRKQYSNLQEKGLEIARKYDLRAIVHSNTAHTMW